MYEYKARIKRIVDGDTLDLQVDLGFNVNINIRGRLVGVNTPERGHEDFHKASVACRDLLRSVARFENPGELDEEWWITIKTSKTGKFGRWLVDIDGVNNKLKEIWPYD